jgi:hypothetical protein
MTLLSRARQENALRFRGQTSNGKKRKGKTFNPESYLDSLNESDFRTLFHEWITQCWIYDNTELVPVDQKELETFDLNSLIPDFRREYINGDWKVISEQSGATIDEMYLYYQMLHRQTLVFLLNEGRPPLPAPLEIAKHYFVEEEVIFSILLEFINYPPSIVLITDGKSHHVFNPFYFDAVRGVIQYKDNIGENGKCFLSKENNALKIDSRFIGHNDQKDWCWEISVEQLKSVFFGVPIFHSRHDLWNALALNLANQRFEDIVKKHAER